ncbi:MAG: hydrolase [Lachnospiraceae bacterium]|nr:hydrolase [Lachnospiraceae bacterium]
MMIDNEKNIKRFEALMEEVKRDGKEELMDYIHKSDLYTAPASTRFHLSCKGGLLQHSLNVYHCLQNKLDCPTWHQILGKIDRETMVIVPLLHDICKTYFYKIDYKNQKTYDPDKVAAADRWQVKKDNAGSFIWETVPCYTVNDLIPYGHGEKSVMMIEQFMKLTGPERFAIRWHMGYTEPKESYQQLSAAMTKYPLALALQEADQEASTLLEDENGNRDQKLVEKAPEKMQEQEPEFEEAEPIGGAEDDR